MQTFERDAIYRTFVWSTLVKLCALLLDLYAYYTLNVLTRASLKTLFRIYKQHLNIQQS